MEISPERLVDSHMKKVLMIPNHSYMFWQFRRELVQGLVARGCDVTLAVPFGERVDDLRNLGIHLIDTPMDRRGIAPVKELSLIRQYQTIIDRVQPDLVITYSIKPNIYAGSICSSRNIPFYMNVQGIGTAFQIPGMAQIVTNMYRRAAKQARVVFFENQENAKLFRDKRIVRPEQQLVLSGAGINLEHYAPAPYPHNDRVHFLYLGRLMKEKGIDELFSAVRRLYAEGETFFLDLVGFFEESYKEQVEELEKLGICRFHGFQMETRPYYAQADCVVLPSYHEGMSNVLLESAAIGRPVITSDIPGCREAVDHGSTGFTCPARDAYALYETMKKFLTLSRETREAMGIAGTAKMRSQFDKRQVVEATLAAIFKESHHEAVH